MMKRLTLSVLTLMTASVAMARELNPDEALSAALQRLAMTQRQTNARLAASRGASAMKLTFTQRSDDQKPLFYVYDLTDGGYVIAAADDRAHSLLGYTDEGSFLDEAENPAFAQWQQQCTEAMEWLSRQPEWPAMAAPQQEAEALTPIAPLLGNIQWNQRYPFNAMCPYRTDAEGKQVQAPTGCAATATAQLMMYHQWPLSGTGSHTNENDSSQTVDFSQSIYDWANIKPTYPEEVSAEEAAPVAKLFFDICCGLNMNYTASGSNSNDFETMNALATYFKYDKGITRVQRSCYTTAEWNQILRQELCQQCPFLLFALSSGGGHAFVIDGYDENGLYHVNWGWGGFKNGYFDMDYLDPDMPGICNGGFGSYNVFQRAIVNIRRDEAGTSQASARLQVGEPLTCNASNDTLRYSVINYGLGDFTGSIGMQLQNREGEVVDDYRQDFSSSHLAFTKEYTIAYAIPERLQSTEGLIARPIYSEGGADYDLDNHPLSAANSLFSYDTGYGISWKAFLEDQPMLKIEDWKMAHNYVGYTPRFQFTITNLASSEVEYNDLVQLIILEGDDLLCYGKNQLFLKPGETKTIEVDGNSSAMVDATSLQAGSYKFELYYMCGSQYTPFYDDSETGVFGGTYFTMVETAPCDITYSDFAIDKNVVEKGTPLTVSFTADNTGGYVLKTYVFYITPEGQTQPCDYFFKIDNEVEPYCQTLVTFSGVIDLAPGNYYGAFFDYSEQKYISSQYASFTVTEKMDPTIAITPTADADSQSAAVYDLLGRRIDGATRHGIYVVGGKKIIK